MLHKAEVYFILQKNSESRKLIFPCNTRKRFVNLTVYYMVMVMLKRDIQGKFALKNDDYRQVRSLRLTDDTWKALGIAAECLGMTRADYLEEIVKSNNLPSNTWGEEDPFPCNTRKNKN
jgi:hypothetical protein